jgi:hypothetical protein
MLDFEMPSGEQSANIKSPMRLNSANAEINATVDSLVNSTATRTRDDKTVEYDQAMLRLSFPSLESDNNYFTFSLRFPNKTVVDIAQEIFLYSCTKTLPNKNTKIAKAILSMCDKDGVILYDNLEDFAENFKLSGSVSKLYSILRENKATYDLSDFASSLAGQSLKVQTYYNSKLKDFTVATTDFVSSDSSAFNLDKTTRTPRSKRGGSLW